MPPVTLHSSRTHVERISVFTSQLLNYNGQSLKSGAENESGGGPRGSQTTAALPVRPSEAARSRWLLLSEPPDNIRALWEISRSGPTALCMDHHTHAQCVCVCVLMPRHSWGNHVISHSPQHSSSVCVSVPVRLRTGGMFVVLSKIKMTPYFSSACLR